MRRLIITTICTADVKETWTIDVPDDFDLAEGEGADDILDRASAVGNIVSCVDEADNERDRDITNVEEEPVREDQTLTDAHRAVLAQCEAETWRNRENGDLEAQSEDDVAADIAQWLYTIYRVAANDDGMPGMLAKPVLPEFEYAVEYDVVPAHYFYDRAEADLEKAAGAPPTMSDIKQRAEYLADADAELTEVYLLCPYPDCQEADTIVEVDSSIRWNDITIELDEGRVVVSASTGKDGDSEFDHFLCTACQRRVSAPADFEIESYD